MVYCGQNSYRQRYASPQQSKFVVDSHVGLHLVSPQHFDHWLWWRVLLLITVWTTLNHIRFEKMFFQSASWIKHSLTHWPEQRCLDFYRQRQISQSDCKITGDCGKKLLIELISYIMFNSLFAYVETSNWMCHSCGQQNRKSFLSTILYYGDIK